MHLFSRALFVLPVVAQLGEEILLEVVVVIPCDADRLLGPRVVEKSPADALHQELLGLFLRQRANAANGEALPLVLGQVADQYRREILSRTEE